MLSFIQIWKNLGLAWDMTICHSSDKMSVDSEWPPSADCWLCMTVVLYIVVYCAYCQNTEIQPAVIDGEKYPATTANKTVKNGVFCQIYVKIDLTNCVKWLKLDTKSKSKLFVFPQMYIVSWIVEFHLHLEHWLMYWCVVVMHLSTHVMSSNN